jgi:hypothetical protein
LDDDEEYEEDEEDSEGEGEKGVEKKGKEAGGTWFTGYT